MIKLLVAIDQNNGIGYQQDLLYKIPADLKRFKDITTGQIVLFGMQSFKSLPVDKLPNRLNVVLTRNKDYVPPIGVFKMNSIQQVLNHYETTNDNDKDLIVCGGSAVYEAMLPHADEVLLTYIDKAADKADTFFNRKLLEELFYITKFERNYCEKNQLDFYYVTCKNKKKWIHDINEFK